MATLNASPSLLSRNAPESCLHKVSISSPSEAGISRRVTKCFLGRTRVCPTATGCTSKMARKLLVSATISDFNSLRTILQKTHSSLLDILKVKSLSIKTFFQHLAIDFLFSKSLGKEFAIQRDFLRLP